MCNPLKLSGETSIQKKIIISWQSGYFFFSLCFRSSLIGFPIIWDLGLMIQSNSFILMQAYLGFSIQSFDQYWNFIIIDTIL